MPLDTEDFKQLEEVVARKDEKLYAWLRYLIGLASGAITILLALGKGIHTGVPGIAERCAITLLAVGILLGAVRLYAEVYTARGFVNGLAKQIEQRLSDPSKNAEPISAPLPKFVNACESECYFSFLLAMICFIVVAWTIGGSLTGN